MRLVTELATNAVLLGCKTSEELLKRIYTGEEVDPPARPRIKDDMEHENYKPLPLKARRKLLEQRRKANR